MSLCESSNAALRCSSMNQPSLFQIFFSASIVKFNFFVQNSKIVIKAKIDMRFKKLIFRVKKMKSIYKVKSTKNVKSIYEIN
jgi:hypothetical protein